MTLRNEIKTERDMFGTWTAVFSWYDGTSRGNPIGSGDTEEEAILDLMYSAVDLNDIDAGLEYIFDLAIAKWKELRDAENAGR